MPYYKVHRLDGTVGIRWASRKRQAESDFKREVGTDMFSHVALAKESDVAWVRGMGGHVPPQPNVEGGQEGGPMRILDLCSGTGSATAAFKAAGHTHHWSGDPGSSVVRCVCGEMRMRGFHHGQRGGGG